MPVTVIYRTDDYAPGNPGVGRRLTNAEVDANFRSVQLAVEALETDRPEPDNIASIAAEGPALVVTLDSGTEIGPIPIPVVMYRDRGNWEPLTEYLALDVVTVPTQGIYSVRIDHESEATFNENFQISGDDVYHKIYADNASVFDGSIPISALPAALAPLNRGSLIEISHPTGGVPAWASQRTTLLEALTEPVTSSVALTYGMVAADANSWKRFNNASDITVTVMADDVVAWSGGVIFTAEQVGDGQIEFVADTGVTLNCPDTHLPKTNGKWSVASIKRVGANEWTIFGNLEPV